MTNNTNNTNNMSNVSNTNTGNPGGAGGDPGAGYVFADRDDYPFVDEPSAVLDQPLPYDVGIGFSDRNWSSIWFAWRALTEFAQTDWKTIPLKPPNLNIDKVTREIGRLIEYARLQRADALSEILCQKDEFISYFMGLLDASPSSHPATYKLMHIANLFAAFMAMYYKGLYNRARPSQLYSMLLPPVSVPGHASYPSGHATQANLIARCASLALQYNPRKDKPRLIQELHGLAARIGRNREIGGFHYRSDTKAGQHLAGKIFDFIEANRASADPKIPKMNCYKNAVDNAQKEMGVSEAGD